MLEIIYKVNTPKPYTCFSAMGREDLPTSQDIIFNMTVDLTFAVTSRATMLSTCDF
jgi:hypothetical protein